METNKQIEYVGVGSLEKLADVLAQFSSNRVFLVTGKQSFTDCGAEKRMEPLLTGKTVKQFSDFHTSPDTEDIAKGVEEFKKFNPDIVIAVGGGSAIDIAKAINRLALEEKSVPLVAIPTTSGTGSESTHFAVVYKDKIKSSLAFPNMLPAVAIVDPTLTYTLAPDITATTGADALCQAIESYWSMQATEESKSYAKEALLLAFANLKNAVISPSPESRIAMSRAAHLAGKAINISKTTAAHALSYPFTAHFGVPHGHAVALTLAAILRYNASVPDNSVITEIIAICGATGAEDVACKLEALFRDIGFEMKLSNLGVTENDIEMILNEASLERMQNNPRKITREDAKKILETIL